MNIKLKILRGFTLIELLVVIGVMGILSSIALISYQNAQKQARDTQKKSDLKQYQTSLENYANNNNNFYPSYKDPQVLSSQSFCNVLGLTNCPEYPGDSDDEYYYISNGADNSGDPTASNYTIYAYMESKDSYIVGDSSGVSESTTPPGATPLATSTPQSTSTPVSCSGCMSSGTCYPGTTEDNCGLGGGACIDCNYCPPGVSCSQIDFFCVQGQCTEVCEGCLDQLGGCQPGNTNTECGSNGVSCVPCLATQSCVFDSGSGGYICQ